MIALDRPQLVEQRVIDVVADLGVVEDVVAVVVVRELPLELVRPLRDLGTQSSFSAAGASSRARS